jgi:hypothetical protein
MSINLLRVKSKTMFLNDSEKQILHKFHRWKFRITPGAAIDILAEKKNKINSRGASVSLLEPSD